MLPHENEEPRAGRPPQPRRNKRKNPAHTKPSSGEREWKSGWRALTKDTETAAVEQPDLKAVILSGKTPRTLDQKLKAVSTEEKCISLGKQVPMPAAGRAALPWTASTWQKHCLAESMEQQKTTGGGRSLPWTWCKARNVLRAVCLCWRTGGWTSISYAPLSTSQKQVKFPLCWSGFVQVQRSRWVPTNVPHVADTGTLVQPILPSPPHSCSPAPGPKPLHCSHTGWHHCCHTVLIASQRTGIRLENSCRFPEIN